MAIELGTRDRANIKSWGSTYLCRIKSGLPRHLKVTLFPSGMSASLISILARAKTSADALILLTNLVTKDLAA